MTEPGQIAGMAEGDLITYRGNCHCAKFVFEVKLPEIKVYDDCNCSICRMKGYAWVIPAEGNFRFVKGSKEELKTYSFGNGYFIHCFCSNCGISVMGDCPPMTPSIYINARTIQKLDIWPLKANTYDGKALPPPYEPPVYVGPEPSMDGENGKIYHGSCHCGAVKLAIKLQPLETWDTLSNEDQSVLECNCSYCVRAASVWCYPLKKQSEVQGVENISHYIFNEKISRKAFCKRCGVLLYNEPNDLSGEEVADLNEDARSQYQGSIHQRNINLRILHDFDFKTLKTQHDDGAGEIPGNYVDP